MRPPAIPKYAIWLLAVCSSTVTLAQEEPEMLVDAVPESQATMFVEAMGSGVYWSLNYEYTFYDSRTLAFHSRLGLGIWRIAKAGSFYSFPVHLGCSVGRNHRAEATVGMTPYVAKSDNVKSAGVSALFPVVYAGYRFQQASGGFFFRAGALITPLAAIDAHADMNGKWAWNPGISIGTSF